MSNRFFIIVLAGLAILLGFFFATKQKDNPSTAPESSVKPTEHVLGEGKSGVVLIEYGDFQCSACFSYEPVMKEIQAKYKESIHFKFRHFPLTQIHSNALVAARAAEAASLQGKFWEMHDLLYNNQDPTGKTGWVASTDPTSFFEEFARQIALDVNKFLADLKSSQTNDIVQADLKEALGLGFNGTPSFTLDGKKIERPESAEGFYKLIDEAIAKKSQ